MLPKMTQKPEIAVGVMGAPQDASPELGRKIVEEAVAGMSALFTKLEKERTGKYRTVPWTPEPIRL